MARSGRLAARVARPWETTRRPVRGEPPARGGCGLEAASQSLPPRASEPAAPGGPRHWLKLPQRQRSFCFPIYEAGPRGRRLGRSRTPPSFQSWGVRTREAPTVSPQKGTVRSAGGAAGRRSRGPRGGERMNPGGPPGAPRGGRGRGGAGPAAGAGARVRAQPAGGAPAGGDECSETSCGGRRQDPPEALPAGRPLPRDGTDAAHGLQCVRPSASAAGTACLRRGVRRAG